MLSIKAWRATYMEEPQSRVKKAVTMSSATIGSMEKGISAISLVLLEGEIQTMKWNAVIQRIMLGKMSCVVQPSCA